MVVELLEMARTDREARRQPTELRFAFDEGDASTGLGQAQRRAKTERTPAQDADRSRTGVRGWEGHHQLQTAR